MDEKKLQRISQQAARVGVNVGTMAEAFRRVAEMSVPTGGLANNSPSAQPGWITWDSGKFPEESGYYIVTAYDGSGSRVTFAKYQKRLKRWELTGARAYWRVLAWMPLPEPWEGES